MVTHTGPDFARVIAFADRLASLDASAWERIQARCAKLDAPSLGGLLARGELIGRGLVPGTDPYADPPWHAALTAAGSAAGVLTELAVLLGGPAPDRYEREAERLRQQHEPKDEAEGAAAMLSLFAMAARHRATHPGTAAALQSCVFALLLSPRAAPALATVYGPFEPEIPYASLVQAPDEHAA